jgi:hypothetical protein
MTTTHRLARRAPFCFTLAALTLVGTAAPASSDPVVFFNGMRYVDQLGFPPGINNAGVVVMEVSYGSQRHVWWDNGTSGRLVVDPDLFKYTTHPTISDNGLIAFLGERVDGGPRGIWVKNAAGPATLIAENGAGGLTIGDASCAGGCDVNDNGQVIFWSPLPSGGAGV